MASANPFNKKWQLILINMAAAFVVMLIFSRGWYNSLKAFAMAYTWNFVIFITQWIVIVYTNDKIEEYVTWKDKPLLRASLLTVSIVILSPLTFLVFNSIISYLFLGRIVDNTIAVTINVIYVAFGSTLFFSAIGFFKAWKNSLIENERVKMQMLAYKYESLQNQINPHFLFNSFNVLTDLVYEDQKKAVKFIKQLSQLFRYVLDSRDKELVALNDELEFIKSFTYLLQTRFEDKLSFEINVEPDPNELIVPMTLQLLIENCVKHNEISSQKPLKVTISKENGYIEVKNKLQIKQVGAESTNTGLSNIQEQFGYFTQKPINIDKTNDYFSVKVPLITSDANESTNN